ncbi:MAG: ABC transporter ATP-binding protein [Candidatus Riflebacteria bacterium]|nr:ABC transporter ATP-binding protein [Candidatus Riflebacteria bacterium]
MTNNETGRKIILSVKDVLAGYDQVPVLFGVSIDVSQGELIAIVGSNGAGKSTLMRVIAGLMKPSGGVVEFLDRDVTNIPAHKKVPLGISYVPEGRRLFPKLTVCENLELGAYVENERSEISRRLEEVFSLFPILKDRAGQTAETMSGGEQQMCAIARGMMSKPKLLMIDEVSLGLMPSMVEKVLDALVQINRGGTTIIIVEQMVQEALEIAHRGYVVQTGKIVLSGKSQVLLDSEEVRRAYMGM